MSSKLVIEDVSSLFSEISNVNGEFYEFLGLHASYYFGL